VARVNRAGTFGYEAARAAGALPSGGYGAEAAGLIGSAAGGVGASGGLVNSLGGVAEGAAGMALGGPVGAMVGKVARQLAGGIAEAVPKATGSVIAAPAKVASMGLEGLAHSLRELQGPLGPVGLGLDAVGKSLETVATVVKAIPIVGSVLGPLGDVLAGIPGVIKGITSGRQVSPRVEHAFRRLMAKVEEVTGRLGGPARRYERRYR
jgi:hypothetical protein